MDFHRWFTASGPKVRRVVVAAELAVTALFAFLLSPWAGIALAVAAGAGAAVRARKRRVRVAQDREGHVAPRVPAGVR
jgi:ABC-type nickel/cobalt efflux system permease component RcnA